MQRLRAAAFFLALLACALCAGFLPLPLLGDAPAPQRTDETGGVLDPGSVWPESASLASQTRAQKNHRQTSPPASRTAARTAPRAADEQDGAPPPTSEILAAIRREAQPLTGDSREYDPLMDLVGNARFVLLGEATHGTDEFYRERTRITQRLIAEKGFTAIAIEGEWPAARRVDRYIHGQGSDAGAEQALSGFTEFPVWMWKNEAVAALVEWLRDYNEALPAGAPPAGFYGLDLYSLHESADAVVEYLEAVDPAAAERARQRYRCFEPYRDRPESYGGELSSRRASSCEAGVEEQFHELEQWAADPPATMQAAGEDTLFSALQNARVVKNAEEFYRTLHIWGASSWNVRDRHMAETLEALSTQLAGDGAPAKIVVWAHNTHVGDYRATQLGEGGELNLGQLIRERHGGRAVLVGFTTYTGTVMAASSWGGRGELKQLRPSIPESYGDLFHAAGIGDFLLLLRVGGALSAALAHPRPQRAIGVIYHPQSERLSHYFDARLSRQFDAVIYLEETRAVEPLDPPQ